MKKLHIFFIALVALNGAILFTFLQGKLSNHYISLIVLTIGLGLGIICRYSTTKQKNDCFPYSTRTIILLFTVVNRRSHG